MTAGAGLLLSAVIIVGFVAVVRKIVMGSEKARKEREQAYRQEERERVLRAARNWATVEAVRKEVQAPRPPARTVSAPVQSIAKSRAKLSPRQEAVTRKRDDDDTSLLGSIVAAEIISSAFDSSSSSSSSDSSSSSSDWSGGGGDSGGGGADSSW